MANKKHLIEFIGNGVHKDLNGDLWCKSHENPDIKANREYSDDDYAKRMDIHFMVTYGAMKHTEVDLTPVAPVTPPVTPVVTPVVPVTPVTPPVAPVTPIVTPPVNTQTK